MTDLHDRRAFEDIDGHMIQDNTLYKYLPCFGEVDPNLKFKIIRFSGKSVYVKFNDDDEIKRRKIYTELKFDRNDYLLYFEWNEKCIAFEDLVKI